MPDELTRSLELIVEAVDKEAREITREAGNILLRHAREEAPSGLSYKGGEPQQKTGRAPRTLKQSLHRTGVEKIGEHTYAVAVSESEGSRTEWGNKTVGFLVQSGTRPHPIKARDPKGFLAFATPAGSLQRQRSPEGVVVKPGKPKGRQKATFGRGISGTGRAKQTRNTAFAQYAIVKSVKHPGTPPNPFMDRAVERAEPEIDAMIVERLNRVS